MYQQLCLIHLILSADLKQYTQYSETGGSQSFP